MKMLSAGLQSQQGIRWPFAAVAIVLFSVVLYFGGWPWGAVCLASMVAQSVVDPRVGSTLVAIVPSLLWLALSLRLDNRELFFPFTMLLATYVALLFIDRGFLTSLLMGNLIVAGFTAIRLIQDVTMSVLFLELAVSTGILVIAILVTRTLPQNAIVRGFVAAWASLLAFAGLIL